MLTIALLLNIIKSERGKGYDFAKPKFLEFSMAFLCSGDWAFNQRILVNNCDKKALAVAHISKVLEILNCVKKYA